MKSLIYAGILAVAGLLLPGNAQAAPAVVEVMSSSATCNGVSISTDTANQTRVVAATEGVIRAGIMNEDTTKNLFCNELSYVATSGSSRGFKILPGQYREFSLTGRQAWYCISDGASSTNGMLCKGRS